MSEKVAPDLPDDAVEAAARAMRAHIGAFDEPTDMSRELVRAAIHAYQAHMASDGMVQADHNAQAEKQADMSAVGESLMEVIADNQEHPLLKDWAPISDPAEIVTDLLNAYDELQTELADAMRIIQPFADACSFSTHDDDDVIDDTLAAGQITFRNMRAARTFFSKTGAS